MQKVVEGKSTELDLSESEFTHIPGGVVETWKALTTLNLTSCESLAALPESIEARRSPANKPCARAFDLVDGNYINGRFVVP